MGTKTAELPKSIRFGEDFELDTRAYELRSRGIPLKLKPIALDMLLLLLENRGQLVTREQIVERIWGKSIFLDSDNSINAAMSKIRQALRDDPEHPQFIQTVTGKGYRFLAPILGVETSGLGFGSRNAQRSTVVGRTTEIDAVCAQLARADVRLITLTGVGGVGKTTLAQAVALRSVHDFTDGAFFVDLSALQRADLVAATIAQGIGIRDSDCGLGALKEYFVHRKSLLVLDNFEQILPAASVIAELLAASSGLKILVTSRALLQVHGEHEYLVCPLATPVADVTSASELKKIPSVELFLQRAGMVNPRFSMTDDNASAIANICAHLEGIPLALELAAARTRVLSPQAILSRLDHRLNLLTGGSPNVSKRQQTMRGTLEWSYELLSEQEKGLFRRLAVFTGTFSFEAAEAVLNSGQVLDGITSLVNQSLLLVRGTTEPRLHMLEVVREYALEKLASCEEEEIARRRHAEYYRGVAEEAEPELQGPEPGLWVQKLHDDYDSIRAAIGWALEHEPAMAERMTVAVRYFWNFQGYLTEGMQTIRQVLRNESSTPGRRVLLNMVGNFHRAFHDPEAATKFYEQGIELALADRDLVHESLFCRGLGGLALDRGDYDLALKFAERSLEAAREANDQFRIAQALNLLGDLARARGENAVAIGHYRPALQISRELQNKYATGNALNNLAGAEYMCGDYSASREHFTEALTTALDVTRTVAGNRITTANSLDGFGALAAQRGDYAVAATLAGAAEHLREVTKFGIETPERRLRDRYLEIVRTQMSDEAFREAFENGRTSSLDVAVRLALDGAQEVRPERQ